MRSRWRPSPAEERWLEVESRLGAAVPRAVAAERTGGWRSTGPLARIALFVLGLVAAALILGILGFRDETTLLVAGLIAALAAEWLTVAKRLHASGVEEGLCVAGFLMIGAWITTVIAPRSGFAGGTVETLVLIVAVGAAGLRLLNPLVTTCAVIAFVYWVGSTATARALDQTIGSGVTTVIVGCALATLALVLGAREYRRPSHDRMLDWLVATLPVAAYARPATWNVHEALQIPSDGGTARLRWWCCCSCSPSRCWSRACAGDGTRRCSASWAVSPASQWSCVWPQRLRLRPGSSSTDWQRWSLEWRWTATCGHRATASPRRR